MNPIVNCFGGTMLIDTVSIEQCLCILIHQFKLKVPPPRFLCTSIAGMICADREMPRLVTLFSLAITPSSPRLDLGVPSLVGINAAFNLFLIFPFVRGFSFG